MQIKVKVEKPAHKETEYYNHLRKEQKKLIEAIIFQCPNDVKSIVFDCDFDKHSLVFIMNNHKKVVSFRMRYHFLETFKDNNIKELLLYRFEHSAEYFSCGDLSQSGAIFLG